MAVTEKDVLNYFQQRQQQVNIMPQNKKGVTEEDVINYYAAQSGDVVVPQATRKTTSPKSAPQWQSLSRSASSYLADSLSLPKLDAAAASRQIVGMVKPSPVPADAFDKAALAQPYERVQMVPDTAKPGWQRAFDEAAWNSLLFGAAKPEYVPQGTAEKIIRQYGTRPDAGEFSGAVRSQPAKVIPLMPPEKLDTGDAAGYQGQLTKHKYIPVQDKPESILQSFLEGIEFGAMQDKYEQALYRLKTNPDNPEYQKAVQEQKALMDSRQDLLRYEGGEQDPVYRFIARAARGGAEQLPRQYSAAKEGLALGATAAATYGGTAAILGGAPAVPAAVWGFKTGMAVGMANYMRRAEAGNAYAELIENGVEPEVARPIAEGVGIINGIIEMSQIDEILKTLPGGLALLNGVKRNAVNRAAGRFAEKYAKAFAKNAATKAAGEYINFLASETLQEVVQEAVTIAGSEIAAKLSDNPAVESSTVQEILSRLGQTAVESGISFSLMPVPGMAITQQIAPGGQAATTTGLALLPSVDAVAPAQAAAAVHGIQEEPVKPAAEAVSTGKPVKVEPEEVSAIKQAIRDEATAQTAIKPLPAQAEKTTPLQTVKPEFKEQEHNGQKWLLISNKHEIDDAIVKANQAKDVKRFPSVPVVFYFGKNMNLNVNPFPGYAFRGASMNEFNHFLKEGKTGNFWTGDPTGAFYSDVIFVGKEFAPYDKLRHVEDNGVRTKEQVYAVFSRAKPDEVDGTMFGWKLLWKNPHFDLKKLNYPKSPVLKIPTEASQQKPAAAMEGKASAAKQATSAAKTAPKAAISDETYQRAYKLLDEISNEVEKAGVDTFDFDAADEYTMKKYGFKLGDISKVTEAYSGQKKYGKWGDWTEGKAVALLDEIEQKFKGIKVGSKAEPTVADEVKQRILAETTTGLGIVAPGTQVAGQRTVSFQSSSPEVQQRVEAARGIKPTPKTDAIREWYVKLRNVISRDFEHLPYTKEYAELRNILHTLKAQKEVATEATITNLRAITAGMNEEDYSLFSWKVLLDDLKEDYDMNPNKKLPFGYDGATLEADYENINAAIQQNKTVSRAIELRRKVWDLKKEYISAMKDIGADVSYIEKRQNYFRHQVLYYQQAKYIAGTGKKLETPKRRGFLKARAEAGTELDHNTDYLQAEYEVMAQMKYDIEVAKALKALTDKGYNIADEVKEKAKLEAERRKGWLASRERAEFKAELEALVQIGDITQQEADELLNAQDKKAAEKVDWHDFIPDGYVVWQPEEGNVFFLYKPLEARIIEKALKAQNINIEQIAEIDPRIAEAISGAIDKISKKRPILAMGGKRTEFVVKEEVAKTLDNLTTNRELTPLQEALDKVVAPALRAWKVWQLASPQRIIPYNFRNLSGDAEAVFLGNPAGFAKVPEAVRDLLGYFKDKKPLSGNLEEWFKRGGMQTTLQVAEIGDINNLQVFANIYNRDVSAKNVIPNIWHKYWRSVRLGTDFREAVLRYANFLSFKEQLLKNGGKVTNYAASDPETINGLSDINDKAYNLANDLLGAYDRISIAGKEIRKYLMPFWSFQEVNVRRYIRLLRNASLSGKTRFVGVRAARAAYFLIKAQLLWVLLAAYNSWFFPDEEKELPNDVKRTPHIIFGRDKDGNVLYRDKLGVLTDFVEWFGLDASYSDIRDWLNGRKTARQVAKKIIAGPPTKIINMLGPQYKLIAETVTGKKLYPDPFAGTPIRDKLYNIAQSLSLGDEYNAVTGRPSKPYTERLKKLLFQVCEAGESAYYDILDLKRVWMEQNGLKPSSGGMITPKSNALYNLKLSAKVKDKGAFEKYLVEYKAAGGTMQGLQQSFDSLHPLFGLSNTDKRKFKAWLKKNKEDAAKYEKAIQYYKSIVETARKYSNKSLAARNY